MGQASSITEIETVAVRLLTSREHSRKELLGKLTSRGYPREQVEAILDNLAQRGLQSDTRFAEGYLEGRVRKGYGPLRIRAELHERGIDESRIERALEPYAEQWWEQLRRVHTQKYGAEPPKDRKELARRARFLEYRGFPAGLIGELLFH
jgi:regulatory protein